MVKRMITDENFSRVTEYARRRYSSWRSYAEEVEIVWKGDYTVPSDIEGKGVEVTAPSQAGNIIRKLDRMMGIRREINISCIPEDKTGAALDRAEKRERGLRAFLWLHRAATQRDVFRGANFWSILRGRGPLQTRYEPEREDLKIRILDHDPMEVWPVRSVDGIAYFVIDRYMTRFELQEYFEGLSPAALRDMAVPDLVVRDERGADVTNWEETQRVTEVWDDTQYVWGVGDSVVQTVEHGYGFVPLSEMRFNWTPLDDQRWASQGVLAPVLEDLKQIAKLQSKMASSVELFYYPTLIYKNTDGALVTVDTRFAGEWQEVADGFTPMVLNPDSNHEGLQLLLNEFNKNVGQGTLNPIVFTTDLPNVSGFMVSQILSTVKDDIADYQDAAEWAAGHTLGNVLRLMEAFADEQPGGAWEFPVYDESTGRKQMESITADDIRGNYRVEVSIKIDLPQDRLQKATIFNQLYQIDPATGAPRIDFETAMEISELSDDVPDFAAMKDRINWYQLRMVDEEVRGLYLAKLRADYGDELEDYRKAVESAERKAQQREERRIEKEIDANATGAVILPEDIASDPNALQQLASMVAEGMTTKEAAQILMEGGLPLGAPGQQPQPPEGAPMDDGTQQLIQALFGGDVQVGPGMGGPQPPQMPDGMTGYDNGIAPAALPAAMQGAQPRQVVDQARVQLEQDQQMARRGALPPPK